MHTLHDMLKESIEKYYHKLDEEKLYEQHLGIVEALKEKDSELARTRVFQHLEYVESCVREGVESERVSNDR
jgi:DNA-binding FadR family transcriptional regulator